MQTCPGCGSQQEVGIKFCGMCGHSFTQSVRPPPQTQPVAQPSPRVHARTVMGMPGMQPPAPAAQPPGPVPVPAPGSSAASPAHHQRTMLGMPLQPLQSPPSQGFGVPIAAPPQPQAQIQTPGPVPGANPRVPPAQTNRTMLGVAQPTAEQLAALGYVAPPGSAPAAPSEPIPPRQRAMVSYNDPNAPAPSMSGTSGDISGDISIAGLPSPHRRKKKGSGAIVAILGLGIVVLLGAAIGIAYLLATGGDSDVRASIAQTPEGEALLVELPGAPNGTKVRFAGQERVLAAGRATFPLAADALRVGDNALVIDILAPNGETSSSNLTLTVDFRVRADLAPLAAPDPAFDVVVDALPGSQVTLDGQALTLDPRGHGSRRYPLASFANAQGAIDHTARWRIQPPNGAAAEGALRTRVPATTMQIDRPGESVVTDQESIEIAGAVAPGAIVTIDGQPVPVNDGRFLHRLAMPAPGTFTPRIVARAPGKAPNARTLEIRRVQDLAAEAARFRADPQITWARMRSSPDSYRGQNVAFEGRVYNVEVAGGRTKLQMLVRDCPVGERCPLWVEYPAATDVQLNGWVRVLGTAAGIQQFRSESDRVVEVPRVDAVFVVPLRR